MKNINFEINELLEQKTFEELSAVEQEIVLSQMSRDDYMERYELLRQFDQFLDQDRAFVAPDPKILKSLKQRLESKENSKSPKTLIYLPAKVSIYKSAAAVLLAILGSYFLFGRSVTKVEYLVQEKIVERKVYDTIYKEQIREVPIEKVVRVVEYKPSPDLQPMGQDQVHFTIGKLDDRTPNEPIELNDLNGSYGNSKIQEDDLEQFRVSM